MFAICKICVQDVNSEEVLVRIKFPEHDTHGCDVYDDCVCFIHIMGTTVQYLETAFLQIPDTGSTHTASNTPAKMNTFQTDMSVHVS